MVCSGSFVFQLRTQAELGTHCCAAELSTVCDVASERAFDNVLGPDDSDCIDKAGLSGRSG